MARDDYLPPDLEAKASSARRRQKLAETMLAQSLQPRQGRMAGRIYVAPSPLEGIAQVAQAWAANRAGERADEQLGEIGQQGRERTVKEIARIRGMMEGDPGLPAPQVAAGADEAAGMPMPAAEPLRQGVAPDPKRAVWEALFSPDRRVAEAGKVMFQGDQKAKLAATLAELKLAANGGDPAAVREWNAYVKMSPADQQAYLTMKRAGPWKDLGGEYMRMPEPLPVPRGANGAPLPVASPGTTAPQSIPKTLDPGDVPAVRGQQAGAAAAAKGAAEANTARVEAARGGVELLDEAESILNGGMGENPTGSGLGTLVDSAGRFVGYTPEGARAAARLGTIGSQLTLRTPRMQGPQSDKDRALYEEAAGKVGEPTKTRAERLEALKVARSIIAKYDPETGLPKGGAAAPSPAPGMTIEDRLKKYR